MKKIIAPCLMISVLYLGLSLLSGCGPAESVHPTTALTEEQKAAIKAEDELTAQEESYGTYNKKPKKR